MKKFILLFIIFLTLLFVLPCQAAVKFRVFYGLTGGGTGALDSFDGASCTDGDLALTIDLTNGSMYLHVLDDDASGVESSPDIINPDTNPGTKSWILKNKYPRLTGDDDPDVAVTGQISYDTDRWIRLFDGTYQVGIPIDFSIIKIADKERHYVFAPNPIADKYVGIGLNKVCR